MLCWHTFVFFVKERTSVNFNSERKCCGVDQMFLKDVANAQLVLEYPVQIGKDSSGIDSGVNVHVMNGARDACSIK